MTTLFHEKPLVTIVTVTYNSAPYVRDAIESVLAQDYDQIEYIIGDDCSTDNTWAIINEYQDPRIIKYQNEINLKEYPNRNKAISLAKGKYLIFIDGDDIIYEHGISYFVRMMERFPNAAFCVQKGYFNNIIFPIVLAPEDVFLNYYFGKKSLLTSSFASNFFRLDLLNASGGLKTIFKIGDEEIRLRLAAQNSVLFVAGWVSWPRETPGQASSMINASMSSLETYNFTIDILQNSRMNQNVKNGIISFMNTRIIVLIIRLLLKGKWEEALPLKRLIKMTWSDMLRLILKKHKNILLDPLKQYKPENPFRIDGSVAGLRESKKK